MTKTICDFCESEIGPFIKVEIKEGELHKTVDVCISCIQMPNLKLRSDKEFDEIVSEN